MKNKRLVNATSYTVSPSQRMGNELSPLQEEQNDNKSSGELHNFNITSGRATFRNATSSNQNLTMNSARENQFSNNATSKQFLMSQPLNPDKHNPMSSRLIKRLNQSRI